MYKFEYRSRSFWCSPPSAQSAAHTAHSTIATNLTHRMATNRTHHTDMEQTTDTTTDHLMATAVSLLVLSQLTQATNLTTSLTTQTATTDQATTHTPARHKRLMSRHHLQALLSEVSLTTSSSFTGKSPNRNLYINYTKWHPQKVN